MERSEHIKYNDLLCEIKELNCKFVKDVEWLKRNVNKNDFKYTANKIFKDKEYIGFAHLIFLMDSDKKYRDENFLVNLFNNYSKKFTLLRRSYFYYIKNINTFISRVFLWNTFFHYFTINNYPNFRPAVYKKSCQDRKKIIELFYLDKKTKNLIPLKTLFKQVEKGRLDSSNRNEKK